MYIYTGNYDKYIQGFVWWIFLPVFSGTLIILPTVLQWDLISKLLSSLMKICCIKLTLEHEVIMFSFHPQWQSSCHGSSPGADELMFWGECFKYQESICEFLELHLIFIVSYVLFRAQNVCMILDFKLKQSILEHFAERIP